MRNKQPDRKRVLLLAPKYKENRKFTKCFHGWGKYKEVLNWGLDLSLPQPKCMGKCGVSIAHRLSTSLHQKGVDTFRCKQVDIGQKRIKLRISFSWQLVFFFFSWNVQICIWRKSSCKYLLGFFSFFFASHFYHSCKTTLCEQALLHILHCLGAFSKAVNI